MIYSVLNLLVLIAGLATLISGKIQINAKETLYGNKARNIGLLLVLSAGMCLTGIPYIFLRLIFSIAGGSLTIDFKTMLTTWIVFVVYGITIAIILIILKSVSSKQENNG
jgi:hypothetical protein